MKKRTLLLPTLFLFAFLTNSCATHNYAGVITYKQLDDNTVEASIITYTNADAIASSANSLTLCWGDGNCEIVFRVNGPDNNMDGIPDGETIDSFFNINIYTAQHTYAEFGEYLLSMTDPNRNGGILNVNFPNSDMVPFHVETWFKLQPLQNGETNQSPVILEPPISWAFEDQIYLYAPNAFDQDDDRIVYELTVPLQDDGTPVPNYQFPCNINTNPPGLSNCSIDANKGLLTWNTPQVPGAYVFAILIESYKDNVLIDQMVLDYMVIVEDDPDIYPEIEITNTSIDEIFPVNVGDTVVLDIQASDPDDSQTIEIASSCGLYDFFDEPATFEATVNGNEGTASFEWIVREEHVREQPYLVVITTKDDDDPYPKENVAVVCYQFEEFITNTYEVTQNFDIQLFPNPAFTKKISLIIENHDPDNSQFAIYNAMGQLKNNSKIISNSTEIDLSKLPSGVYFLKVKTGKNTTVKSFVIP